MSKTEKIYNLNQVLEEMKQKEGLPKSISTEAQLCDEILKKQIFVMAEQILPLIKEVYHREYFKDVEIKPLATEYSVERTDTKEITSIRSDITIVVGNRDIYHFECQINWDGNMVVRMFEYDTHIAMSYVENIKNQQYLMRYPYSAVLYLQDDKNVPKELKCEVRFQDNARMNKINRKTDKGKLTSFYEEIILILKQEVEEGYLSENNRTMILQLLRKSMIRVFYKDDTLLREVMHMTEPVLELEFEFWEREFRERAEEKKKEFDLQMDMMRQERDAMLQEKDAMLQEKDAILQERDAMLQEKDAILQEKDAILQEKDAELEILREKLSVYER